MPVRREFLKSTAAVTVLPNSLANESVVVGVIGPGGMGKSHAELLSRNKGVRVAWVCDVDERRTASAVDLVERNSGKKPAFASDLRKVLDDRAVDAVFIATPDHWHSPATLLALAAGKHVYVEKPMSHNIREGRLVVDAAKKANKVVQVGTQSRSSDSIRQVIARLRAGEIGEVWMAKAWNSQLRGSVGKAKPTAPPKYLDFELWQGPAPKTEYRPNLLPGSWRWFRSFGTGDVGNDGVHEIDIARWGLGVNGLPDRVAGLGGKYAHDDDQEFPDTYFVTYEWLGNGKPTHRRMLVFEQRDWSPYVQEGHENGVAFYGTKGMLILGKAKGWQLVGERNKTIAQGKCNVDLAQHHENFLASIRGAATPNAGAIEGHESAALAHLANITCTVGRQLSMDVRHESIVNDAEANSMLSRIYLEGHWAVPKT